MIAHSIFVYCDSPAHPKRVAVTNFDLVSGGMFGPRWIERPSSRAGTKIGTGQTIVNDLLAETGWANTAVGNDAKRDRYELVCRKCRRPMPVRQEKLAAALDACESNGLTGVSLAILAATLRKQSRD